MSKSSGTNKRGIAATGRGSAYRRTGATNALNCAGSWGNLLANRLDGIEAPGFLISFALVVHGVYPALGHWQTR